MNDKYEKAIEYRKRERNIKSLININDIKIMSQQEKILISKDIINEVICRKIGLHLFDNDGKKRELLLHKKELKKNFFDSNTYIDELFTGIESVLNMNSNRVKPSLIKINQSINNDIFKRIGELFFNNNYIYININDYFDELSLVKFSDRDNKSIFSSIKEHPVSLLVLDNYEEASYKIKKIINHLINDCYYEDIYGNKYYFNNCLIVIISNKNSIGFDKQRISSNFDKEVFMI